MLIDTTAPTPPAVCWFIDRTRVRAGLGPQRIEPTGWYRLHDGTPVSIAQTQPEDATLGKNIPRPPDSTPLADFHPSFYLGDKPFTHHKSPSFE